MLILYQQPTRDNLYCAICLNKLYHNYTISITNYKRYTMLTISTILIITLLHQPINSYNCTTLHTFEHSTCQFHFKNDTNCHNFNFMQCTWQRCVVWKEKYNKQQCDGYQLAKSTDWHVCTSTCCLNNNSYGRSWDFVDECQAVIDQNYQGSTGLSGATLGLIILMTVLGSCCLCYCGRTGCLGCCCRAIKDCLVSMLYCQCLRRSREVEGVDHNVSQNGISGQNQANQWKYASSLELRQSVENVTCCVCLQDHTALQLQCGHLLHKECMRECIKKKSQCPLCRSSRINGVRIYCQKCYNAYLPGNLVDLFRAKLHYANICDRCSKMQESKG